MRSAIFVCVVGALVVLSSCGRSRPPPGETEAGTDDGAVAAAEPRGEAGESEVPIALTEERLDKYLVYRKEMNAILARYARDAGALSKSIDSKSSDLSKTATAIVGTKKISERYESETAALRKKHGFSEGEDDRLWSAIADVVAAKASDHAFMEASVKEFRVMQQRGGAEKDAADEFFKSMEEGEKQGLDEARRKYGERCVDILSKRSKDLSRFIMTGVEDVAGAAEETE